jgi:catecholate siderophore receptor
MIENKMPARVPGSLRSLARQPGSAGQGNYRTALMTACCVAAVSVASTAFAEETKDKKKDSAVEIPALVIETSTAPGANPYADPAAPYKVDRSADGKISQDIQDFSKEITIIPKEAIKDSGATSVKDVIRQQPGITIGTGEGGNALGDRFIIRGFEARGDVMVDGLRDPGIVSRETFAIEQIEISKGPDSTFAGRGTTGGAINMITKMPQAEDFTTISTGIGTDGYKRVTVDSNQVVSKTLAVRANGMWHDSNVPGRSDDVDVKDDRWGGAISFEWQANEDVTLLGDYYHVKTDALPDYGVPWNASTKTPYVVDGEAKYYGQLNRDFWETSQDIATLQSQVRLSPDLNWNTKVRYGYATNEYVVGAPEGPNLGAGTVNSSAKQRRQNWEYYGGVSTLAYEFQTGAFKHTLISGVEATYEEARNPGFTGQSNVTVDINNPNNYAWTGTIRKNGAFTASLIETQAAFLSDTMELSEQWQVFGGVRFDHYSMIQTTAPGGSPYPETSGDTNTRFFNWHAGVTYKPRPNGSFYVAIASASNPPGAVSDSTSADYGGNTTTIQSVDPERVFSYEAGTKWSLFDEHLLLSTAIFQIEKDGGLDVIVAGEGEGERRVRGIEVQAAGNVTPELSLIGGLALFDADVIRGPAAMGNPTGAGKMVNTAERSASLQAKYALTDKWSVGSTVIYKSQIYGGTYAANPNTSPRIPGWVRVDFMSDYKLTEAMKVQLNVLNAFDKLYFDAVYRSGTPFVFVAPGRSATLTLEYTF